MKKIVTIASNDIPLNYEMEKSSTYYQLILIEDTVYWVSVSQSTEECVVLPYSSLAKKFGVDTSMPGCFDQRLNHYYDLRPERLIFSTEHNSMPSVTFTEIRASWSELMRLSQEFKVAQEAKISAHAHSIAKTLCEQHRYADLEIHCKRFMLNSTVIMEQYSPAPTIIVIG